MQNSKKKKLKKDITSLSTQHSKFSTLQMSSKFSRKSENLIFNKCISFMISTIHYRSFIIKKTRPVLTEEKNKYLFPSLYTPK